MIKPSTMLPQQYCLKWKYHNNNIQFTFSQLLEKGSFCDVTIWCNGVAFRAHRAVLASCSALLSSLLDSHDTSWGEPALVLEKTEARHLTQLLAFMYTGEVSVHHTELAGLLKTAEELQIKGLADVSWKDSKAGKASALNNLGDPLALGTENVPQKKNANDVVPSITTVNGSLVVPPIPMSQSAAMLDAVKRKRGRPPLEPIDVDEEPSPKLDKIPDLNTLKKIESSAEMTAEWKDINSALKHEEVDLGDEGLSDYSEASLDGDISQFLDTTMEVEGSGEVNIGDMSIPMSGGSTRESDPLRFSTPGKDSDKNGENKDSNAIPPQFADVIKLSDYLVRGRRPQFWAEDYVKRVMEAVFCKELEMKQAAELLGVSYGTLYGRYRDCFGCINRPYRVRDFWTEKGPSEIVAKLLKKELSLFKAAELLNVNPQTLTTYLTTLSESQVKSDHDGSMSPTSRKSDEEGTKPPINRKKDIPNSKNIAEDWSESEEESKDELPKKEDSDNVSSMFLKTPLIRVADLKFLQGDKKEENDTENVVDLLKNHPDLTMVPTKRKDSFQNNDEAEEDTKANTNGDSENASVESIS